MGAVRQLGARRIAPVSPSDSVRHLRIGVVHRGRIIEEQLLAPDRITVGSHARASILLPGDGGPPDRLEVFTNKGGSPHLRLSPGIRGKVDLGDGVVTLESLRDQGPFIALPPTARGKVQIGDFTLLFQLVDAPARPMDPRGRSLHWKDVDWIFLALVLVSSLMHAAAVVWIQSQPPPTRAELQDLVQEYDTVFLPVAPEPDVTPAPTDPDDAVPTDPETPSPPAAAVEPAPEDGAPPTGAPEDEPAVVEPEVGTERDLEAEAKKHGLLALGTSLDKASEMVLGYVGNRPELTNKAMENAWVLSQGLVRHRDRPGLKGPTSPGEGAATIGEIEGMGGCGGCTVPDKKKVHNVPDVPEPIVTPPLVLDGEFDPMPFLRRLRAGFKFCYEKALKSNPDLAGRVSLSFTTNGSASVDDAWIESDSMHSETANACMLKKLERLSLPEDGANIEVSGYSLVFTPQ